MRDGSLGICRAAGHGGGNLKNATNTKPKPMSGKQLQNAELRRLQEQPLPGHFHLTSLILLHFVLSEGHTSTDANAQWAACRNYI